MCEDRSIAELRKRQGFGPLALVAVALALSASAFASVGADRGKGARGWLFECGSDPFALSVFDGPTGAEQADSAPAVALRKFLEDGRYRLPKRGWRILTESEERVQFGHGDPRRRAGIYSVDVEPKNNRRGTWKYVGLSGGCRPTTVLPRGFGGGTWRPRKAATIEPEDTRIKVWVHEQSCASGASAKGRIARPKVAYGRGRIVIAPKIRFAEGNFHFCVGNPRTKHTFRLAEPIGDRLLMDGYSYRFRVRHPR